EDGARARAAVQAHAPDPEPGASSRCELARRFAEMARNLRFREPVRRRGKPRLRVIVYRRRSSVSCAGLGPALAVSRLTLASRRSQVRLNRTFQAVSARSRNARLRLG